MTEFLLIMIVTVGFLGILALRICTMFHLFKHWVDWMLSDDTDEYTAATSAMYYDPLGRWITDFLLSGATVRKSEGLTHKAANVEMRLRMIPLWLMFYENITEQEASRVISVVNTEIGYAGRK